MAFFSNIFLAAPQRPIDFFIKPRNCKVSLVAAAFFFLGSLIAACLLYPHVGAWAWCVPSIAAPVAFAIAISPCLKQARFKPQTLDDAIENGNLASVQECLELQQEENVLEEAIELASCLVNQFPTNRSRREILLTLHQEYAHSLKANKEEKQAEMLFHSAELCMDGFQDPTIQQLFAEIAHFYVPECPHAIYVTDDSLKQGDSIYHANQFFYAQWCHLTALATAALIQKTDDLHAFIQLGGRSRHWLAEVCFSKDASCFGAYRWQKGMTVGLVTPINDPASPQYHPWYALTHRRYEESNGTYQVMAVDTDGKRYRGTAFGELRSVSGKPCFGWLHRKNPKKVHPICQNWLKKVAEWHGEDLEEFYRLLGMYYHALTQYSPFERGSASFSYTHIIGHLLAKKTSYPAITLPKAITLLDCYALSLQAEEFVEEVFLPWCLGQINEEALKTFIK